MKGQDPLSPNLWIVVVVIACLIVIAILTYMFFKFADFDIKLFCIPLVLTNIRPSKQ